MSLLDTFLQIIAPHSCINCGREGSLLCPQCSCLLSPAPQTCYRCQTNLAGGQICSKCMVTASVISVHAASTYEGAAKELIWRLKYAGAHAAVKTMAAILAKQLDVSVDQMILVPVPTSPKRARQRGYDQAELLANELGRLTGLPCRSLLRRASTTHQVGASRGQRQAQVKGVFTVVGKQLPQHVVLVDDVLTTGSTLEEAAKALRDAGVKAISIAVFARA